MVTLSSSNPVDTPTVQYLEWLFLDNHDAWGNMRAKRAFKPDYFAHAKLLGVDCGKLYGSKNKPLFLTTLFSKSQNYVFFNMPPKWGFCLVKTKLSIFQKTKQLVLPWKMTPESCSAILSTHLRRAALRIFSMQANNLQVMMTTFFFFPSAVANSPCQIGHLRLRQNCFSNCSNAIYLI